MKFSGISARRNIAGISAAFLLGGIALAISVAPLASAAPDCSAAGVAGTLSQRPARRGTTWPPTPVPTRW